MADVMSKSSLLRPCAGFVVRSSSSSSTKRGSSIVRLPSRVRFESLKSASLNGDFHGRRLVIGDGNGRHVKPSRRALPVQMGLSFGKSVKWWEKGLQPNMKEINSAQDLVDSLLNAGNKLVVVDFFSPGCGGCKALHPKICQFAEMNPDVMFLKVNYEEHKSMCYSLNVHVLPFFRFYRGAHGRLCSFSCTNATIKKFKDALAKHSTDRCSLGPARGLEEAELVALSSNKDLSFSYNTTNKKTLPVPALESMAEATIPSSSKAPFLEESPEEKKTLVSAGR
ncbi:hypothetical protein QJS10_CPA05g00591 [Acorus calamus]|uniref:Thioredoxin domain-containing protein n=1 Tax=Acorus calamus TaxID=4465 RepID=A0AAV9EQZ9_ACOCL|nr:hypothetical protein QJS10_CPA05g00591 [Acorus calamus]